MNSALTNLVITAYNSGLLQYDPLTVCGLTVTMVMKTRHNVLTYTYQGIVRSNVMWDTDCYELQENSIQYTITELLDGVK